MNDIKIHHKVYEFCKIAKLSPTNFIQNLINPNVIDPDFLNEDYNKLFNLYFEIKFTYIDQLLINKNYRIEYLINEVEKAFRIFKDGAELILEEDMSKFNSNVYREEIYRKFKIDLKNHNYFEEYFNRTMNDIYFTLIDMSELLANVNAPHGTKIERDDERDDNRDDGLDKQLKDIGFFDFLDEKHPDLTKQQQKEIQDLLISNELKDEQKVFLLHEIGYFKYELERKDIIQNGTNINKKISDPITVNYKTIYNRLLDIEKGNIKPEAIQKVKDLIKTRFPSTNLSQQDPPK